MPKERAGERHGSLEAYRLKRTADQTPEPFGTGAERPRLFVVQKHAARRLHYDFRLELGGVLRSWAVPKGPSPDPADKRFAAEVEDHPVEYADFEGIIPKGNYGAGPVIVWDRGQWQPVGDPEEGLARGKLLFELRGYKLRGVWTLVKTRKGPKEWLLIKERDRWAGPEAARALDETSILSGLTLEELASGEDRAAAIRDEIGRAGAPQRPVEAGRVELMLAETAAAPFSGPGWLFELKHDGYRLLAARERSGPRLLYRRGHDATAIYPEVAVALARLPFPDLVLDGEVVVLDDQGRSVFERLQKRALLSSPADAERAAVALPATLFAFDLLGFDGFDLRPLPLATRKAWLRRILPAKGPLRYCDHVETHGEALYAEVRKLGLEGVLAKRADSPYRGGRSPHWLKVRVDRTGDFVVIGFTVPQGARSSFGALHLALVEGGRLVYAGRVGSGFDEAQLGAIRAELDRLRRDAPACAGPLPKGRENRWVEPRLVVEVRYKERTEDGMLRQPVFLRRRDDKAPEDCAGAAADEAPPPTPPAPAAAARGAQKKVPFTNLDKVFWPEHGYTKGDLIEFYRRVSPWLLPYLADRPVVLTRFPDGIHGKSFFQKDAPDFAPAWVRTVRMWSESGEREIDYFVCDQVEMLLYLVNLGTIPLHIWSSRLADIQHPDWCILDLDPKGAPFRDVVTLALAIRRLCDEIEVPCFLKTSGASGLHVLVPLGRQLTYAESRSLGELLARVVIEQNRDIATFARPIGSRQGRVYVDTLQNGHGRLLVSTLSVRPLPGAPVSTPLLWSEAGERLDPSAFTIRTVPERLERMTEDPLRPVLDLVPDLGRALARLGERLRG